MAGEGGTVDDKSVPEVIKGLRALLQAIEESRMSCSPAYRNRLQVQSWRRTATARRWYGMDLPPVVVRDFPPTMYARVLSLETTLAMPRRDRVVMLDRKCVQQPVNVTAGSVTAAECPSTGRCHRLIRWHSLGTTTRCRAPLVGQRLWTTSKPRIRMQRQQQPGLREAWTGNNRCHSARARHDR